MRYAAIPLAIVLVVTAGCFHTPERPVHVTVQNPPAGAPPPTVVIEGRPTNDDIRPPNTTITPAAPPVNGAKYYVDDIEVIYNDPLHAYTVTGYRDYYYLNGRFYRFDRGRWEGAPSLRNGDWVVVNEADLPNTLVLRYRR
jgi:hypothetical protein